MDEGMRERKKELGGEERRGVGLGCFWMIVGEKKTKEIFF